MWKISKIHFFLQLQKQEPSDEERNDSGVTSGGSDIQSSPSGSEHSEDSIAQHTQHANLNTIPYYSTPMMSRILANFTTTHTTQSATLTGPSQHTPPLGKDEETDPLTCLQKSIENKGLYPTNRSQKNSETSTEGEHELEEFDDQGVRVPKVNSHGKVKTFKCKQCDFIAITKMDFWEHSKQHIKTDKLLTCPKCPFVTEYKHHLEYHLRNHAGSKPFECDKCEYTCVNKSMLNSHMKSHSNIYQYRCANCNYATKYCHSLKLHLRKYEHEPAMVLNPDGTPNPLPIIDVYGTRRGPKQKVATPRRSPNEAQVAATTQAFQNSLAQYMLNQQIQFPYPIFPPLTNPLLLQQSLMQLAQAAPTQPQEEHQEAARNPEPSNPVALDLTKQDDADSVKEKEVALAVPQKHRRKGVAFRLDLNAQVDDTCDEDDDMAEEESASPNNANSAEASSTNQDKMEVNSVNSEEMDVKVDNYCCLFCRIGFADVVMYTMHMGYHGYQNPFTCNMCGVECHDKIGFFLHIARTPHL